MKIHKLLEQKQTINKATENIKQDFENYKATYEGNVSHIVQGNNIFKMAQSVKMRSMAVKRKVSAINQYKENLEQLFKKFKFTIQ